MVNIQQYLEKHKISVGIKGRFITLTIDDFYCVFWVDTNENWFIAMYDLVKYRNYTLNKEQHG